MTQHQFETLVRKHGPAVAAYARSLCRDRWAAEEAVQETFLRAWRYLDSFRGTGSFEGWLLRICRNCVIDLAQQNDEVDKVIALDAGKGTWNKRPHPVDESHDIHDMIARLPLPQREVLMLCGVLGYDYKGAAAILEIPVGTVRSRLHRARVTLAGSMAPDEREELA